MHAASIPHTMGYRARTWENCGRENWQIWQIVSYSAKIFFAKVHGYTENVFGIYALTIAYLPNFFANTFTCMVHQNFALLNFLCMVLSYQRILALSMDEKKAYKLSFLWYKSHNEAANLSSPAVKQLCNVRKSLLFCLA